MPCGTPLEGGQGEWYQRITGVGIRPKRCCGTALQGVDFFPKGVDPVSFKNLYRLFSLVHAHNDYGLATFSPTKIGVKIEDIDV